MADWPLIGAGLVTSHGVDTATSEPLTVVTGGAAHTKGSWVEVCSSIPKDVCEVQIVIHNGHADAFLHDLGIGAAGSEQVIIANIPRQASPTAVYGIAAVYRFPIGLPAGERLAIRVQSDYDGSRNSHVSALLISGSFLSKRPAASKVFTYGANTADSGGTSVAAPSTANTKGPYVEFSSGVEADLCGIMVAVADDTNTNRSEYYWLLDVAIGEAGSEQNVVENLCFFAHFNPDIVHPPTSGFLPVCIPKNSRLSVRVQCSGTDATDRRFDVILFGIAA